MQVSSQPLGLLFAFLLGLASAATSACCTLPAIGVLLGYSGAQKNNNRKAAFKSTFLFTLGTILALIIVGALAGFAGKIVQNTLGQYWKSVAGVVAIFFGLAAMDLLPFKLSFGKFERIKNKFANIGDALAGLILGGIVAVSSLPCNPGIFIVIGAAFLQGNVFWACLLLGMFAIGFAIPLGVIMLGISLGKTAISAKRTDSFFRYIAGSILIIAGFYFVLK